MVWIFIYLFIFLEVGSQYLAQAGLKLTISCRLASDFPQQYACLHQTSAEITGVSKCNWEETQNLLPQPVFLADKSTLVCLAVVLILQENTQLAVKL